MHEQVELGELRKTKEELMKLSEAHQLQLAQGEPAMHSSLSVSDEAYPHPHLRVW